MECNGNKLLTKMAALMRQYASLLIISVLALIVVARLFHQGYVFTADGLIHLYRVFEFDRVFRQGILYPRWVADLALGHGYPVFSFYSPLAYYLAEVFHSLGYGFLMSTKLSFAASVPVAGWGFFFFAKAILEPIQFAFADVRSHQPAPKITALNVHSPTPLARESMALLAAIAYMCLPYLLEDIYQRGALAEAWAMAFLPAVFWAFQRLLLQGKVSHLALGAVFLAGLVLTHNLTPLLVIPVLVAYVSFLSAQLWWAAGKEGLPSTPLLLRRTGGAVGALFLAGSLSAFLWLPALAERQYLSPHGVAVARRLIEENSWSLPRFVQTSLLYDYSGDTPLVLGLVQLLLAVCIFVALVLDRALSGKPAPGFWRISFFAGVAFFAALLAFPVSWPIWQGVPLLSLVQFPWRLLTIIGLATSLLIGSVCILVDKWLAFFEGSGWNSQRQSGPQEGERLRLREDQMEAIPTHGVIEDRGRHMLMVLASLAFLALLVVMSSVAGLSPTYWTIDEDSIGPALIARHEINSGTVGLDSAEYLPGWATRDPGWAVRRVRDVVREGELGAESAPLIELERYSANSIEMKVRGNRTTFLLFHILYFPGWHAYVDGEQVEAYPTTDSGLIGLQVPAGDHRVCLRFEDTPIRTIGNLISLAGVGALCALLWLFAPEREAKGVKVAKCLLPLACLCLVTLWPLLLHGVASPSAVKHAYIGFGGRLKLLGYAVEGATTAGDGLLMLRQPAEEIQVKMYWQVLKQMKGRHVTSLRLLDERGNVRAQRDALPLYGGSPTSSWMLGEIIEDHYSLALEPGLPAGRYRLEVGIYDSDGTFLGVQDAPDASRADLGLLILAADVPDLPPPPIEHPLTVTLGEDVALLGYELETQPARPVSQSPFVVLEPGDVIELTLYWQAQHYIHEDFSVFVHLLDRQGSLLSQADSMPGGGFQPTSLWDTYRVVTDRYQLPIPADTPPGLYDVKIGMYRYASLERLLVLDEEGHPIGDSIGLGTIKVRSAYVSLPRYSASLSLGDTVRFAGYDLQVDGRRGQVTEERQRDLQTASTRVHAGETLHLVLYWEALSEMSKDYTVFTHLLNVEGRMVAQQDNYPGEGGYPTSIWEPGEVIVDSYDLYLPDDTPPGAYVLEIGMYDLATGQRLSVFDTQWQRVADDGILLADIIVDQP